MPETRHVIPLQEGREPCPANPLNLLVLKFAQNNCYTNLVRFNPENLYDGLVSVDADRGTWVIQDMDDSTHPLREIAIGHGRECFSASSRRGVIGIYDQTKLVHMGRMMYHAQDAIREEHYS